MADKTHIEWTDATWNVVTGCSVLTPGCTNCYAMRLAGTRLRDHPSRQGLTTPSKAGPVWNGKVRFNHGWLDQPLQWTRPRQIFVAAHGDLFHEGVTEPMLDAIFAVMAMAPQHIFQVLTKRAERMAAYLGDPHTPGRIYDVVCDRVVNEELKVILVIPGMEQTFQHAPLGPRVPLGVWPLANVWAGVSVEDQPRAEERVPQLLATPAAVRWVSAEPLLGPVKLGRLHGGRDLHGGAREDWWESSLSGKRFDPWSDGEVRAPKLDWVVVGGESGPNARPMHPDWARRIRDDCAAAGVAFLFKQWGEACPLRPELIPVHPRGIGWINPEGRSIFEANDADFRRMERDDRAADAPVWTQIVHVGKKAAGRELDGRTHDGFPEVSHERIEAPASGG